MFRWHRSAAIQIAVVSEEGRLRQSAMLSWFLEPARIRVSQTP